MNNQSRAACTAPISRRWSHGVVVIPPRRSFARARQVRERILATLAFVMLIVAWDATMRLDERVAPPRMRVSHAVEREIESPAVNFTTP